MCIFILRIAARFQSTLPVWGATPALCLLYARADFNPRSPCGERLFPAHAKAVDYVNFNPRSPCGERLIGKKAVGCQYNFNPRSPCGERRMHNRNSLLQEYFNPRSPCGERRRRAAEDNRSGKISIHAPRVGSDSCRRTSSREKPYFNPRSPCGERLSPTCMALSVMLFQSTLPVWGATGTYRGVKQAYIISIHAPRVGSDLGY